MHTSGVLRSCKSGCTVYTFRLDGVSSLGAFQVAFFLVEFVAAVHVNQNHVRLHTRDINIPVSNAVTSSVLCVLKQSVKYNVNQLGIAIPGSRIPGSRDPGPFFNPEIPGL